ncbi:hypothetical protein [Brevibacillus laterosporus]|uniref:Uncharacterized protein n=1 Tax=Brevibacillus laterosporus TaxID=1465 RepID=A0AAP3DID1_BRELA|nr:hypothetical protein [Brevibacillus laterosporus]MCR8981606.1 hypothetical protein [Brevibacillus laterosporus]MCZ0808761.1 hypothetical protein [Brevibacillus laterosporus]MCZ0827266.1 hypothetical protein [Brevibacillus laterosporus]MCZ0851022.1 hypothetical protein [Brevibacillus laterosporus]
MNTSLADSARLRSLITETSNISELLKSEEHSLKDTVRQIEQLEKKQIEMQRKVNELKTTQGDNILEMMELMAKIVFDRLENVYKDDPDSFYDEGVIDLQQDDLFAQETDKVIELFEYHDEIYSREDIHEYVWDKLDHSVFNEAEKNIREIYQDSVSCQKDSLGYHGLSQQDFLVG